MQKFFVGWHQPGLQTWSFDSLFVSVHRLAEWGQCILALEWVMDSGAFTEIHDHGRYRHGPEEYAKTIRRYGKSSLYSFQRDNPLLAAVAQDFMCERFVVARVLGIDPGDLTEEMFRAQILLHQQWTIERYDQLMQCELDGVPIMPVLQGFEPEEYARHLEMYGRRLKHGMWVGVGSVCKRQGDPVYMRAVLEAIHAARPDLRLHGFGVKLTALRDARIAEMFWSADSMAWSYAARKRWGNPNSPVAAMHFEHQVHEAVGMKPGYYLDLLLKRCERQGCTLEDLVKWDGEEVRANRKAKMDEKERKRITYLANGVWFAGRGRMSDDEFRDAYQRADALMKDGLPMQSAINEALVADLPLFAAA